MSADGRKLVRRYHPDGTPLYDVFLADKWLGTVRRSAGCLGLTPPPDGIWVAFDVWGQAIGFATQRRPLVDMLGSGASR